MITSRKTCNEAAHHLVFLAWLQRVVNQRATKKLAPFTCKKLKILVLVDFELISYPSARIYSLNSVILLMGIGESLTGSMEMHENPCLCAELGQTPTFKAVDGLGFWSLVGWVRRWSRLARLGSVPLSVGTIQPRSWFFGQKRGSRRRGGTNWPVRAISGPR